jgi:hypothetical protein
MMNLPNEIILLWGEPTIEGQLAARKKALANCRSERAIKEHEPSMLNGWIKSHIQTIEKLESLK